MKIRDGFVSNSSSASYIVKIHGVTFAELSNKLKPEYSWYIFDKETFVNLLNKTYKSFNKLIDASEKQQSPMLSYYITHCSKIKEHLTLLEKDISFEEYLRIFFTFHQLNIIETEDYVELNNFTSMHNSFNEGMSEILKEIILFLMSEGYNVTLDKEDDNAGWEGWD